VPPQSLGGIYFSYALLNAAGIPSTHFRYGETFSFLVRMTNLTAPDNLYYEHQLNNELTDSGFGRVISTGGDTTRPHLLYNGMIFYL
jgi:hypothetical protein